MVTKIGEGDLNPGSPNEGEQTMPLSYKSFLAGNLHAFVNLFSC